MGMDMIRLAERVARETGTHVMVHIGDHRDPPSPRAAGLTRELLDALAPGDILSHLCTGRQGGVLDAAGRAVPELLAARERGVVLDSALGRLNFSFRAARALLDQGILPDTISSDMTGRGRGLIVYSLTECMSKFLALGFSLPQVVRMTTANSAAALGMSAALGSLAVGREADLSILRLVPGRWEFRDSLDDTLSGDAGSWRRWPRYARAGSSCPIGGRTRGAGSPRRTRCREPCRARPTLCKPRLRGKP